MVDLLFISPSNSYCFVSGAIHIADCHRCAVESIPLVNPLWKFPETDLNANTALPNLHLTRKPPCHPRPVLCLLRCSTVLALQRKGMPLDGCAFNTDCPVHSPIPFLLNCYSIVCHLISNSKPERNRQLTVITRRPFMQPFCNCSARQRDKFADLDWLTRCAAGACDPIGIGATADAERRGCGVVGVAHVAHGLGSRLGAHSAASGTAHIPSPKERALSPS